MNNYLEMGEPVGSYKLHAFPTKKNEVLSKLRVNGTIEYDGSRFEIQTKVRIAKKLIRSKKLNSDQGKALVLYYCYKNERFLHESPLKALAVALDVLNKQTNTDNQFFVITKHL